jgi:hypothetical protein
MHCGIIKLKKKKFNDRTKKIKNIKKNIITIHSAFSHVLQYMLKWKHHTYKVFVNNYIRNYNKFKLSINWL